MQGVGKIGKLFLFVEYRDPVVKFFDPATGVTAPWAKLPEPCSPRALRLHDGMVLVCDSLHDFM